MAPSRLSKDVVPILYNMRIVPFMEEEYFAFDGDLEMKIKITNTTNKIVMHNHNLNILVAPVLIPICVDMPPDLRAPRVTPINYKVDPSQSIMEINFDHPINPGFYVLIIEFRGCVKDSLTSGKLTQGFRRTKYTNEEGKEVCLASTFFYPIGARRAFPCFDEPSFKAAFTISIKHGVNFRAISNTHPIEVKQDENDPASVWTTFAETPQMSTYSLSFAIADFDHLQNDDGSLRIWMKKHEIQYGKYALEIGEKLMKEYELYTEISQADCGIKSVDLLAIPFSTHRSAGSWGLITFWNKDALIYEENVTPVIEMQGLVANMSHNLSLQWIGNLVSPSWWNELWVCEGLANYFYFYMTDKVKPEWRMMDQMVVENLQGRAFVVDSDCKAPAMTDVFVSENMRERVSGLPYFKGGALLRVIAHIITQSKFNESVKEYLRLKKFNVAITWDLLKRFVNHFPNNAAINKNEFCHALDNWQSTPGFPIITVTRNFTGTMATIEQERFLSEEDARGNHGKKYWIPLNFAQTKTDFETTEVQCWMKPTDESVKIPIPRGDGWVIFNKQQFGYYRVTYDNGDWLRIIKKLKTPSFKDIHVLNRAQLIDDALNLTRISKLDYPIAFELMLYLKQEDDLIPWQSAFPGFTFLYDQLSNTENHEGFKAYLLDIIGPLESMLERYTNIEGEHEHFTKCSIGRALEWVCKLGSEPWNNYAARKLGEWLEDPDQNPLPIDCQNEILCAGIRYADRKTWNQLFEKFLDTMEFDILTALGCSVDRNILTDYLNMVENGMDFDKLLIVEAVYKGSEKGRNIALDFLIENGRVIVGDVSRDPRPIRIFQQFWYRGKPGKLLTTQAQVEKLKNFKASLSGWPTHAIKWVENAIAEAEKNVRWLKYKSYDIGKFLKEYKSTE